MAYLKWDEKTITDYSEDAISALYNQGYLFGRTGKGEMYQTRSLRIDLEKFELSSENRRVLKKTEELKLVAAPLPYADYHFSIAKLGKDFYYTKFGDKTFSANKIKEIMTDAAKSNFNTALVYSLEKTIGYALCYQNNELLHYCYPFYDLTEKTPNLGLGMMLKAIMWAKEAGKKYIYLGSFSRPTDTYKLQFAGLEWWDGKNWNTNAEELKQISHV
jgi:arginine-tRNA-protein transferase